MARSLKALSVGLLLVACGRDGPPLPSAASASASSAPVQPPVALSVAPRWPIRGEVAFDLTVTPKGALLAWAKPTAEGIAIHAALLDAHFSINSGFPTCTRVEGMAVVVE